MKNKSIEPILKKLRTFRDEREWKKFHTHKDLAITLVLEATELLEHFQWKTNDEVEVYIKKNSGKIAEELADVTKNLFYLYDSLEIDLEKAVVDKMKKDNRNYPAKRVKGSAKKYTLYKKKLT